MPATYKDLLYARQRYITAEGLRRAIAIITNATLKARDPLIWGDGTTACASDSKHFGAWDQNLMIQWHVRLRCKNRPSHARRGGWQRGKAVDISVQVAAVSPAR